MLLFLIALRELHIALSEILLTACADQLLYNLSLINLCSACAKQSKRYLFIVSKIDIIWYSQITSQFINYQLRTRYKIFLSLKYLFHFSLTSGWLHFFTRVLTTNFMEIWPFKHRSSKFSLLWGRLLKSYSNKNVLRQRCLDKHF